MSSEYLEKIKKSFLSCSEAILSSALQNKKITLGLEAEDTLYVRYNNHRVRQNTHVEQAFFKLHIIDGNKYSKTNFTLTGEIDKDVKNVKLLFYKATQDLEKALPEASIRSLAKNFTSKNIFEAGYETDKVLSEISANTEHLDFTGITHFGPVLQMVQNSENVKHEFQTDYFMLDYSLFDKQNAVKGMYCDSQWSQESFENSLHRSRYYLDLMKNKQIEIKPGKYRTYLAPGAISEISSLLGWNALSQKAYKTGKCPFQKLVTGEKQLSPLISLKENFGLGLSPAFNSNGEVSPFEVEIIKKGKLNNLLTCSKTAMDYQVDTNFAEEDEAPRSLEISAGNLDINNVLKELGTGLYLSNLHYLNWSDPLNAGITGMTRYACFWVENGEIVGPIKDLRFDESLYSLWGTELEHVTHHTEIEANTGTYYQRQLGGKKIPGMIVNNMNFTL